MIWQRSPRPDLEAPRVHLQTIKSTQNLLLEKDAVAVVNLVADDIVSPGVYRVSKVFVGVEKPLAHAEL